MNPSNAVRPIDSIRGIFAYLIVFHHLLPQIGVSYPCDFGNTIVLFFFVLSGFHITLNWRDRIMGNERTFWLKRCARIFPLQWLATLLCVVLQINVITYWAVPFHLTLTQSAVPLWEINFTLNTGSWFLSSLLFCYLATPPLLKFARLHVRRFVGLWLAAALLFAAGVALLPDSVGHRWPVYISPFSRLIDYSAGMVLALLWQPVALGKAQVEPRRGRLVFSLLELSALASVAAFMCVPALFRLSDYHLFRYPFIFAFIVLFTLNRGVISRALSNRFLGRLGTLSMCVYMLHCVVLRYSFTTFKVLPAWQNILLTSVLVWLLCESVYRYVLPVADRWFALAVQRGQKLFSSGKNRNTP